MREAKANWLGKKNFESRGEAHFNFLITAGIGANQMASGQGGSRVGPRFNFRVERDSGIGGSLIS